MNSLTHTRNYRWLALLAMAMMGLALFGACMVKTEDDTVTVAVDPAWLDFDDFEMIWADPSGEPRALLFKGPLQNESSLTRIPGQGYKGEAAVFILKGYRDGVLVFEQHRDFDPDRQPATVIIVVKDPWNSPTGLVITPKRVELEIGENGQAQASVLPEASPQALTWRLSNPTLAQLSVVASDPGSASITALVQGRTWLKAVSTADPSLRDSIPVDIFPVGEAPPSIKVFSPDTVVSVWDEVTFTIAVQARNGLLASWSLDADGDGTPEFEGPSGEAALSLTRAHVYQDSGNRLAVFTVTDNGGRVSRDTVNIGVRLDPPRVNAGADTVVQPNETVVFDGTAEQDFGAFVMWRWDFDGDGADDDSSAAPKSFVFKYPVEGSYAARLRVRDDDGNVGEAFRTVDVGNAPPRIEGFDFPDTVSIGDPIPLQGRIHDVDGVLAAAEIRWGMAPGSSRTYAGASEAAIDTVLAFAAPVEVIVSITATDDAERTTEQSWTIAVILDAPVVDAGADTNAKVGQPVAFTGSATQKFGTFVEWAWDFDGDGTFDSTSATPRTFQHVYATESQFNAVLRVTDDDGNAATGTRVVDVGNLAPAFSGTLPDTTISIKDSLTFAGRVEDGDGTIAKLEWDFGTGTFGQATTPGTAAGDFSIGRAFPDTGKFFVVARATDNGGKTSVDSVAVTVLLDPPTVNAGNDVSVLAGGTIALSGTASDRFGTVVSRAWKIGNGEFLSRSAGDTAFSAPDTPQTLWGVFRAVDDDGNAAIDSVKITVLASTNNLLESLAVTPGTLAPAFQATTLTYSASVANSVTSVSVTANPADPAATLSIDGAAATAGVPRSVDLDTGANAIPIVVKAQDGSEQTYTVTVTRAADANANLQSLTVTGVTLSPSPFSTNTTAYSATVPYATTSVAVTAATQSNVATLTVNGTATNSNTARTVSLPTVGAHTISVVVTAQNGTTKAYTVTLTRAEDSDNNLQNLVVTGVTLSPSPFAANTTAYTGTVANTTQSVSVTATVQSAAATLTVNGLNTVSGTARTVNVDVGANPIPIVVTAPDGTKKTYTVTITRSQDANANLSGLVPSVGTLSPGFSQNTTTYDLIVPDVNASLTLTPTAASTTSSIRVNNVTVNSGSASAALAVTAGTQTNASVVVTAQSGATRTYTVRMHRGAWVQQGGITLSSDQTSVALASYNNLIYQYGMNTSATSNRTAVLRRFSAGAWSNAPNFTAFSPVGAASAASDGTRLFLASGWTASTAVYAYNGTSTPSTASPGGPGSPKIASGGGKTYLAWWDYESTSRTLYVSEYTGSSWVPTGGGVVQQSISGALDVAVDTQGRVYVAYSVGSNGTQINVRWWNGSIWAGVNDVLLDKPFTTFSLGVQNQLPYLAFGDSENGGRLSVVTVNNRTILGARAFSPNGLSVSQCFLDGSSGTLFAVASLQNAGGNYNQYAWKNVAGTWEQVGASTIGTATSAATTFTMHQGKPAVGYSDASGSKVFLYTTTAP